PGAGAGPGVTRRAHLTRRGASPLRAWRYPGGRRAFINTRGVYDRERGDLAVERADALGIRAAHGVYAAMSGPAYETPTEVGMLKHLGATVVGMSMVPEALPALARGMRVLGICRLTNAFGEHVTHA